VLSVSHVFKTTLQKPKLPLGKRNLIEWSLKKAFKKRSGWHEKGQGGPKKAQGAPPFLTC